MSGLHEHALHMQAHILFLHLIRGTIHHMCLTTSLVTCMPVRLTAR